MQFSLVENGVDSLKATAEKLFEYYEDHEFKGFQVKDAVFTYVHSVEVLSKYLIKQDNEERIFTDKEAYKTAKIKVDGVKNKNVFDVNPNLQTITVTKAINILNSEGWNLENELHQDLKRIIQMRNQLIHYTVNLNEEDFLDFVSKLRRNFQELVSFFVKQIIDFEEIFNGVIRESGISGYEQYLDELENQAISAYESARLDAEADYYDALEEYHKH